MMASLTIAWRQMLFSAGLYFCVTWTIEGKSLFFGWLPPPTAEQSLRRRIWRKRKEARRDEIRNQGWNQEPSVRDLLDDLVTLGPWKWAVGGGGLVGGTPNLHFPHLHQTQIYTNPKFTQDPNLHKPRFTRDPYLHSPDLHKSISVHRFQKTQIYTTQIYTKPEFTQPN